MTLTLNCYVALFCLLAYETTYVNYKTQVINQPRKHQLESQSVYPMNQYRWVKISTMGNAVIYMIKPLERKLSTESVDSTISVNSSSITDSSVYPVRSVDNFVSKNSNLKQAARENFQSNTCHHEIKASQQISADTKKEIPNPTYQERIFSFDDELSQEENEREVNEMSKFIFNLIS